MNRTKSSAAQLAYLSEHMSLYPDMASGHNNNNMQGRAELEKQWQELTNKLNSMGGPIKTVTKWKQAWRDLRNNVKKKAIHNHNEFRGYGPGSTGNGPPTLKPMSSVDETVLSIIGPVAVYGLEDVAVTEAVETDLASAGPPPLSPFPDLPAEEHNANKPMKEQKGKAEREKKGTEPVDTNPTPSKTTRKRNRIAVRQDDFDVKILKYEEEKLSIKRERNAIMEKRNSIEHEKNILLNRIAGVLESLLESLPHRSSS